MSKSMARSAVRRPGNGGEGGKLQKMYRRNWMETVKDSRRGGFSNISMLRADLSIRTCEITGRQAYAFPENILILAAIPPLRTFYVAPRFWVLHSTISPHRTSRGEASGRSISQCLQVDQCPIAPPPRRVCKQSPSPVHAAIITWTSEAMNSPPQLVTSPSDPPGFVPP